MYSTAGPSLTHANRATLAHGRGLELLRAIWYGAVMTVVHEDNTQILQRDKERRGIW